MLDGSHGFLRLGLDVLRMVFTSRVRLHDDSKYLQCVLALIGSGWPSKMTGSTRPGVPCLEVNWSYSPRAN